MSAAGGFDRLRDPAAQALFRVGEVDGLDLAQLFQKDLRQRIGDGGDQFRRWSRYHDLKILVWTGVMLMSVTWPLGWGRVKSLMCKSGREVDSRNIRFRIGAPDVLAGQDVGVVAALWRTHPVDEDLLVA